MARKVVVLDANILIRAVLGQRVRRILEAHVDDVSFFVPETAYAEAEEHLAALAINRGGDPEKALAALRGIAALGSVAGLELYGGFESEARRRLGARDPDDWPVLATALALGCPIWTEASAAASPPGRPPALTSSSSNSRRVAWTIRRQSAAGLRPTDRATRTTLPIDHRCSLRRVLDRAPLRLTA